MAIASEIHSVESGLAEKISGVVYNLKARYNQSRVYRKTLSELSSLSNRDLADIGVHRSAIKSIALQAAIGN